MRKSLRRLTYEELEVLADMHDNAMRSRDEARTYLLDIANALDIEAPHNYKTVDESWSKLGEKILLKLRS